jgi:hypothetical protein
MPHPVTRTIECVVDQAVIEAIAAADRITDPVLRGEILRDTGAVGEAETRTWKLPHWPDPLPPTTALRLLFVERPDLICAPT